AVLLPVLRDGWTDWDDPINFLNNPYYRGLGWTQLRWMLTAGLMGHWIPVTWLTLGADYALWGMRPFGYHLTSLLLHAASGAVFYLVARRLLGLAMPAAPPLARGLGAAAAALFFSIHPLRVESVAWVTERRDLTSGLFFLLTILAYLRWTESKRASWLAASVGCFAGMILSKAMGMTLPLVLLLIAAVLLTVVGQRKAAALYTTESYPLIHSFAQPGYRVSFYVLKTLVPWPLSPLYWFRPEIGLPQALGWIAVLGATAVAFVRRAAWPAAAASWISYGLLIAPVSGVF